MLQLSDQSLLLRLPQTERVGPLPQQVDDGLPPGPDGPLPDVGAVRPDQQPLAVCLLPLLAVQVELLSAGVGEESAGVS